MPTISNLSTRSPRRGGNYEKLLGSKVVSSEELVETLQALPHLFRPILAYTFGHRGPLQIAQILSTTELNIPEEPLPMVNWTQPTISHADESVTTLISDAGTSLERARAAHRAGDRQGEGCPSFPCSSSSSIIQISEALT